MHWHMCTSGAYYLLLLLSGLLCLIKDSCASNDKLLLKNPSGCTCLGDTLTFECTVVGEAYGITVWSGSAFSNCSVHEISILHGQFTMPRSTRRDCNNGSIVAQGLRVDNGSYISQLNVTVTSDVIGKSIECAYDNLVNITTTVGLLAINSGTFQPPKHINLSLIDFGSKKITFSWNQVAHDGCATFLYNILSSNCGSCPTTTTNTTVTCTDVPILMPISSDRSNNLMLCRFALQNVYCENIAGNISEQINVYLLSNYIAPTGSELGTSTSINGTVVTEAGVSKHVIASTLAGIFGIILALSMAVSVILAVFLVKIKSKTLTLVEGESGDSGPGVDLETSMQQDYENDIELHLSTDIKTDENVAYARVTS